jgi:hypothetical protein
MASGLKEMVKSLSQLIPLMEKVFGEVMKLVQIR